jgi:hypothetical protein
MGSSCPTFREEHPPRWGVFADGVLPSLPGEGSRDPARAHHLPFDANTLGRGSRLRDEPAEKFPTQQWRRLDRRAYP